MAGKAEKALTADPARAIRSEPGSHGAPRAWRPRFSIVTASLAVLLVVIVAGGYIAWRWTQDQYYVGADSRGDVVIYRGINEKIAGWNLSGPYQLTGIRLAQVPANDKQTVTTAYASGSLDQVQGSVSTIRADVTRCKDRYTSMREWVPKAQAYRTYQTAYRTYQAALARKQKNIKPPSSVPDPGPQPTRLAGCPASAEFGIASSDLVTTGTGPSTASGDLVTPGAGPT